MRPGLVARPADTDQVAEVMRACAAHGLTVVPRGRGTKLSWGTAPTSADVLLDLSALDRVLDHAAGDLIVATQAGALLADVQRTVAEGGQRLALDETVPGSTVGGVLAANTSGPRRVATGTARDLLIGITMVRADGVVAKAGGRVVKNVAGYDLGKLMIGSGGTLAVITDATFRLHPCRRPTAGSPRPSRTPARALAVAQSVVHAQVVPAAVEVDWAGRRRRPSACWWRAAPTASRPAPRPCAGCSAPTRPSPASEPADGATYPWDVSATGDGRSTALKLTCVLSGVADVLAAADATGVVVRGSAGSGVLYAALGPGTPLDDVRTALDRLRRACAEHGGTAVVVDAPAAVKAAVDVWGPVPALDLMRRVKDQFDPDHRLSPGRFVGGI